MVRILLFLSLVSLTSAAFAAGNGELEIRAVDSATGKPIAVRVHLKDARGKTVRPPKVPFWNDYFVLPGSMVLELPVGTYTFEMERGLEYKTRYGHFILERNASDNTVVEMNRFIDMTKEGWWSGDLYVDQPTKDIELFMQADDLHVAALVDWGTQPALKRAMPAAKGKALPTKAAKADDAASAGPVRFDTNRFYGRLAGRDDRAAGLLLMFNLTEIPSPWSTLALSGSDSKALAPEYPSAVDLLKGARNQPGKHADIGRPFSWDLPVWVASGMVDSVNVAGDHLWRDGMQLPLLGKPREGTLGPSKMDAGAWSQTVYFHLLNCGLRLPPTAGSGNGVTPSPIGYNRVYVHCGDELTWDSWWENLRKGRVVVTNGPLLQPLVNGELPGHVFQAEEGQVVQLETALNLSTREKIDYLELIKDGKVEHEVRLDQWAKEGGRLPTLTFDRSGWMLVRARTTNGQTYRFAMTAPYYVEIGYKPTISKASAQFFLDWVIERAKQLKLEDAEQRAEVLKYHRAARDYWQKKVDEATVD